MKITYKDNEDGGQKDYTIISIIVSVHTSTILKLQKGLQQA